MKKTFKKTISVILSLLMTMSIFVGLDPSELFSIKASAAGRVDNYSATAGVEYARRYALSYNREWYFYTSGGDCANFVSQSLFAGGMSMSSRWHCYDSNSSAYCMDDYTWIRAHDLMQYLVDMGGTKIVNPSPSQFSLGDAVFYDWDLDGGINHSAIVTAIDNGVPKVSAHSTPESQSVLDNHWTYGHDSACCVLVKLYGATCDNDYAQSYDIFRPNTLLPVMSNPGWVQRNGDSVKRFVIRVPNADPNGYSAFNFEGYTGYVNLAQTTKIGHWDKIEVSHLMGNWYIKQAATCTQKGIEERKCSRCGYTEQRETGLGGVHQNVILADCLNPSYCKACGAILTDPLGHKMGDWTYTKEPTCLEGGSESSVCGRCGYTEMRDVAALGHNYEGNITLAGCVTTGASYYKCTRCGDIQYENATWSAYSAIDPADAIYSEFVNNPELCKSRTEYRIKTKSTQESTDSSKDGWTQTGSRIEYGAWGSFSAWQDAAVSETDTRHVETQQVPASYKTMYHYYHYCLKKANGQCLNYPSDMDVYNQGGWNPVVSQEVHTISIDHQLTYQGTLITPTNWTTYSYSGYTCCASTPDYSERWFNDEAGSSTPCTTQEVASYKTQYRYQTRTKTIWYSYEKWSDWGSWSTTPASANATTQVETRTTYSFRQDALDHNWSTPSVVAPKCHEVGSTLYTCVRCGVVRKENETQALGDSWSDWRLIRNENGQRVYRRDCTNFPQADGTCECGHYELKTEYDCVYKPVETIAPTCTTDGYTLYRCSVHANASQCEAQGSKYEVSSDVVPALGHEPDNNWVIIIPATCEEDGLERCKCVRHDNGATCDETYDRPIEKTVHDYKLISTVDPTCTEPGYQYYECANNGEHNYTINLESTGHNMGEELHYLNGELSTDTEACGEHKWVSECKNEGCDHKEERYEFIDHTFGETQTIEPNCIEDGVVYHNCENCGYYEEIEHIAALGHDFMHDDERSFESTCTEQGLNAYTCSRCGEENDKIILPTGHAVSPLSSNFDTSDDRMELVSSEPNVCGTGSVDTYRCTHINNGERCEYTIVIGEANDHNLGDYIVTKEATCIEVGYKHKECQNAGCSYRTDDETIPALGHTPGELYTVKASCTDDGARKVDCDRCGVTLEEYTITARKHSFTSWHTVTEPTCTENGLEQRECLNINDTEEYKACNCVETREIEALDHNWGDWTDNGDGEHIRVCKNDASHKETAVHVWNDSEVTKAATCKEEGEKLYTCMVCAATKTESIAINPDNHSDYGTHIENNKEATCLDKGYTGDTVCNGCDAILEAGEDIPALGHDWDEWTDNGDGNHIRVCKRDESHTETAVHAWDDGTVVKGASCTDQGTILYTCTVCNATRTEEVSAMGHTPGEAKQENYTAPACEIKGGYDTVVRCTVCDAILSSEHTEIDALEHDYQLVSEKSKPADYGVKGYDYYECSHDTSHNYTVTLPALVKNTYTVTFVVDDEVYDVVTYTQGDKFISEPAVPEKNNCIGQWEDYELNDTNITVKAEYTPIDLNDISDIETEKTVDNFDGGTAQITLSASAATRAVKITSSDTSPVDVVLVLDLSGSMNYALGDTDETKLDALKECAKNFIASLNENGVKTGNNHRVALVGFASGRAVSGYSMTAYQNTGLIVTENTNFISYTSIKTSDYKNAFLPTGNIAGVNAKIEEAIDNLSASGSTNTQLGLKMAQNILANNDSDGREKVVILLTDGVPTVAASKKSEIREVAPLAITYANEMKSGGIGLYTVGVDADADENAAFDSTSDGLSGSDNSATFDFNRFLNIVSSNYPNAQAMNNYGEKTGSGYYMSVNDTSKLGEIFSKILVSTVEKPVAFTKCNIVDTLSADFTLTLEQEYALRDRLASQYNIDDSDISVSRNSDGTTTIRVNNVPAVKTVVNGKIVYRASVTFEGSLNKTDADGYYTNTSDAFAEIGGEKAADFEIPEAVNVTAKRNIVVFRIGGEVYRIEEANLGDDVISPETDLAKWNIPDGTTVTGSYAEFEADALSTDEYTVTWSIDGAETKEVYTYGSVINLPTVPDKDDLDFAGFSPAVPHIMPARNMTFTAVYSPKHVHSFKQVGYSGICTDGLTIIYKCACGEVKEEPQAPQNHHLVLTTWNTHGSTLTETLVCSVCGHSEDHTLTFKTVTSGRGRTTYLDLTMQQNGTVVQPASGSTIKITVPWTNQGNANTNVTVYRVNESGTAKNYTATIEKGYLVFYADHFSIYVIDEEPSASPVSYAVAQCELDGMHEYNAVVTEPACTQKGYTTYTCPNCGDSYIGDKVPAIGHTDANNDGQCDTCDANLGTSSQESNCVCGKHHTGPFAGLIKFFHKIIYFFKNLFGKN